MVSHPNEVLQIFTSYYGSLLSAPNPGPISQEVPWLASLHPPTLTEEQLQSLNAPSEQEILTIIKSLKTLKAPGPDGFTSTYYKKFADTLAPRLSNLFNYILQGHKLPEEMLHANMILILKPNKDHSVPPKLQANIGSQ